MSNVSNEEARPEMDDLLHRYFQAEMPHPWPTFKAPRATAMKPTASMRSRYSGRMALAACIALLVAGYLTLGGYFPRSQTPTGVQELQNIGQREKGRKMAPSTDDPMPMPVGNQTTKSKSN